MYYSYNTHNGEVLAFISFESYNDRVYLRTQANPDYENTVVLYNNKNGDLAFNYDGEEILFKDFIKTSMKEIKQKISNNEHVTSDELMLAIICDGMNNVRFGMDMPVPDVVVPGLGFAICGDKTKRCTCKPVEEYLGMPHEDYKIGLEAVREPEDNEYTCEDRYYTSDFTSMLCNGIFEILDSIDDGKTAEEHVVEYFSRVTDKDYFDYKMKVEA